jgi:hypothetical protein
MTRIVLFRGSLHFLGRRQHGCRQIIRRGIKRQHGDRSRPLRRQRIGLSLFIALLVAWGRVAWQLARDATAERWIRAEGLFALAVPWGCAGGMNDE